MDAPLDSGPREPLYNFL